MADHGVRVDESPMVDHLPDFVAHLVNLSWLETLDQPNVFHEFDFPTRHDRDEHAKAADFIRVVLCTPQWPRSPGKSRAFQVLRSAMETLTRLTGTAEGTPRLVLDLLRVDQLPKLQHDIEWRLRLVISTLSTLPEQFHWRVCRYRVLSWMLVELLNNIPLWMNFCEKKLVQFGDMPERDLTRAELRRLIGIFSYVQNVTGALRDSFFEKKDDKSPGWVDVATVNSLCIKDEYGEAVTLQRQMLVATILPTVMLETTTKATNTRPPERHGTIGTSRGYTPCDEPLRKLAKQNRKNPMWLFYSNFAPELKEDMDAVGFMDPLLDGMASKASTALTAVSSVGSNAMEDVFNAGMKEWNSQYFDGTSESDVSSAPLDDLWKRRPLSRQRRRSGGVEVGGSSESDQPLSRIVSSVVEQRIALTAYGPYERVQRVEPCETSPSRMRRETMDERSEAVYRRRDLRTTRYQRAWVSDADSSSEHDGYERDSPVRKASLSIETPTARASRELPRAARPLSPSGVSELRGPGPNQRQRAPARERRES